MIAPLVAALFVASQDAQPVGDSLLRAAPKGTLMAFACDDVPGLVAGLRAGPLGVLWEDPGLAPLRAQLDEALAEVWEQELYPGGPEGSELIEGVRALAVYLGPFEADEPEVGGLALAVRDELARELTAMLAAEASDSELVVVDGLRLQVMRGDGGEWVAAGEWLQGLVFGFGQERERTLAWTHELIAGLEAEPGRATPRGAEFTARRAAGAALDLHFDLGGLMNAAAAEGDPQAREMFQVLGLDSLGWASVTFATRADGALEMRATAEIPPSGLIGQWLSLMRPAPLALGRLAPRDTIDAAFFGMDANGLWQGVQAFLAELDLPGASAGGPTPSEVLDRRLEEVEALLGIDLREAVFENLTGEFALFVLSDERAYAHAPGAPLATVDTLLAYFGVLPPQVGAVHVVGLRDGSAMEELIDALIGLAGADPMLHEHQVGEHWVQSIDLPELPVEGLSPCWVVLDDALLFSGGFPSLRAVLEQLAEDAPPSWLDDAARTRRAQALVDAGACTVAIADSGALFERRLLDPLRELESALDEDAYGPWLRELLSGLAAEASVTDPLDQARTWLRRGVEIGERLRDGALQGTWISTMSYVDGRLLYRSWTEPAPRD